MNPSSSHDLQREPGIEYPSSHSLDRFDPSIVKDVNGYYALLGVDPGSSQRAVKLACRRRMYDLHPDRGTYDPEQWERVEAACRCLRNPRYRALYDALRPPMRWNDEALRRQAAGGEVELSPVQETPPLRFVYYREGDVDVPYERAVQWMGLLAYCHHALGLDGPVRVGFTTRDWYVLSRAWGTVFMVPGSAVPDIDIAAWMVAREYCGERWMIAMGRCTKAYRSASG